MTNADFYNSARDLDTWFANPTSRASLIPASSQGTAYRELMNLTTTRTKFHRRVKQAVGLAEPAIAKIWQDSLATVLIVKSQEVERIVSAWPLALLNWKAAVKKCNRIPRSCFIGVQTQNTTVSILALIRLSDAHLHTNLLFMEKDHSGVPPRMGMAVVDTILEVIAEAFGSERIVLDDPLPELVQYYRECGYETMRKTGRETAAMFKSTMTR